MKSHRPLFASLALAAGLVCALPALTEPLPADHYSGRWLEVGRTPSKLTDGCVAGSTTYVRKDAEHVDVEDDCRKGTVDGERKAIRGKGKILDPGSDHLMSVRYWVFINWRFDVLDHDAAGTWFITGDPQKKRIFIYTRTAPSEAKLAELVSKARATGYTGEIETPAQR